MTYHTDYFDYLRSRLGLLYRRLLLYPRLAHHVSGHVLDVGCGICDFLEFRPDMVDVDVNLHTVEWCRRHGLDSRLTETDRLPFPDSGFDGVVLDNIQEHLTAPEHLLYEIYRVLMRCGQLSVCVPGELSYEHDPDHKVFYGDADLWRMAGASEFYCGGVFHTLMKSRWLASWLPLYWLYGIFERS